jgi:enterochelin esterase-like enzyme
MLLFKKKTMLVVLFCLVGPTTLPAWAQRESYPVDPDSEVRPGVPQGSLQEFEWESQIFEGTKRRFSIYVPAQYDGSSPAALMVFQDGHAYMDPKGNFKAPVVMDNLIHSGVMPITVGVFIDPGHHEELPPRRGWAPTPSNRSFEYDTLSDQYARFLLEEILPEVEKHVVLTDDPDFRAIVGMSSGGICAWTVAWERPDQFRKVVSHIGSFVNIRGGHNYPALIRKADKKPIRVFLQDGSNDLDNQHGNWPLANQQMDKALAFKGYDYQFVFGEGAHNGKHGGAIFPDTLRWLWRDWKMGEEETSLN